MASQLFVLVDYDNLSDFLVGRSLEGVVRHLEGKIPDEFLVNCSRVEFRLYGGWVTGNSLTRQAQPLSAELQRVFPTTFTRQGADGALVTRHLDCSLARAGLSLPAEDLRDTLMTGRSVRNVYIDQSAWRPCSSPASCQLSTVETFIQSGQCSDQYCGVRARDLLKRNEQKQVDTLIVADMAELVLRQGAMELVMVSSDADMWPGILLCLSAGASICHVHTTPGAVTKPNLAVNLSRIGAMYKQVSV